MDFYVDVDNFGFVVFVDYGYFVKFFLNLFFEGFFGLVVDEDYVVFWVWCELFEVFNVWFVDEYIRGCYDYGWFF